MNTCLLYLLLVYSHIYVVFSALKGTSLVSQRWFYIKYGFKIIEKVQFLRATSSINEQDFSMEIVDFSIIFQSA